MCFDIQYTHVFYNSLSLQSNHSWGCSRCGVVWCGLEFNQNHNRTAPYFAITCVVRCTRCSLKLVYFSNFEFFLPSQKLIFFFSFILSQIINYWTSFSLFLADFFNQKLLRLLNYNNIKKKKYIYIYIEGAVWFVWFFNYKTINCTVPCGVMRCSAVMPFCEWFWWTPLIIVYRERTTYTNTEGPYLILLDTCKFLIPFKKKKKKIERLNKAKHFHYLTDPTKKSVPDFPDDNQIIIIQRKRKKKLVIIGQLSWPTWRHA